MKLSRSLKIAAAAAAVTLFAAQPAFAGVPISGAGSSFAAPLISACKVAFQSATGNTVNYGSGGSGTGRSSADAGINEFNFSDASYSPKISTVLHIPVVAAPVAIAYNATGGAANSSVAQPQIYLSQKTLSDIFAGTVTKWNDAEIAADNAGKKSTVVYKKDAKGAVVKVKGKPVVLKTITGVAGVSLPNQPINVIVRSDSSGTTQNLVNFFIAQFSSVWTKASSGTFASVFPGASLPLSFSSASGSSGVAALAAQTPYSITYVESSYASNSNLGVAGIKNAAGNYQLPTAGGTAAFLSAATASATGVLTFNYGTTDPGAYVLGIVSYALVDSAKTDNYAKATTAFLKYLLSDACPNTNPSLQYSTIGGSLLATDNALLAKLAQ
jgi:phosphate transport system substrate-binding protein